jgi:hypothetical protein
MTPDWVLDARFDVPVNATVMDFLRRTMPSARDDVADELLRSAAGLGGVEVWCPDTSAYAFVALHREDGTLIGLAWGQSRLAYRLPGPDGEEAREEGGEPAAELGSDWVVLPPWTDDETLVASRRRLASWCKRALQAR